MLLDTNGKNYFGVLPRKKNIMQRAKVYGSSSQEVVRFGNVVLFQLLDW